MIDFDNTVLKADIQTFGEQTLFQPVLGPIQTIPGIFNERATDTKYQDGTEFTEVRPTLGCRLSDFTLSPPIPDDLFTIRGRLWRVADTTPDGIGHLVIRIMLADDSQANLPATPPIPLIPTL